MGIIHQMRWVLAILFWVALMPVGTVALFYLSGEVKALAKKRDQLEVELAETKNRNAGLAAEWSYLSAPGRIEQLTAQFLPELYIPQPSQLVQMKPGQTRSGTQSDASGSVLKTGL
ncbi:MAG: hypothetical protein AAF418_03465 [Pseudomonadota bacterium]